LELLMLSEVIWADIPAWIGAVGTVGTLATGMILFGNQMRDRRRQYASRVAVWVDPYTLGEAGDFQLILHVKNDGEQPIYDCLIKSASSPAQTPIHVLAPGQEVDPISVGAGDDVVRWLDSLNDVRFEVSFVDAEGRRWMRNERGRLRRVRSA
jgi:hypothetical protein